MGCAFQISIPASSLCLQCFILLSELLPILCSNMTSAAGKQSASAANAAQQAKMESSLLYLAEMFPTLSIDTIQQVIVSSGTLQMERLVENCLKEAAKMEVFDSSAALADSHLNSPGVACFVVCWRYAFDQSGCAFQLELGIRRQSARSRRDGFAGSGFGSRAIYSRAIERRCGQTDDGHEETADGDVHMQLEPGSTAGGSSSSSSSSSADSKRSSMFATICRLCSPSLVLCAV